MRDTHAFVTVLQDKHHFKLKDPGLISFHLGCGFERDANGILRMSPQGYIERLMDQYMQMFCSKPKTVVTSPIEKNDHPELDDSEFLDNDGIQEYQPLIGFLQRAVSLGRMDITTGVMTFS